MSINTQILKLISQRNLLLLEIAILRQFGQYPIGFWQGFSNMNKSLRGFLHHQHVCLLVSVCLQLWEKQRFVMNTSPRIPSQIHLVWMHGIPRQTSIWNEWFTYTLSFCLIIKLRRLFAALSAKLRLCYPHSQLHGVVSRRGEGIAESTIDLLLTPRDGIWSFADAPSNAKLHVVEPLWFLLCNVRTCHASICRIWLARNAFTTAEACCVPALSSNASAPGFALL